MQQNQVDVKRRLKIDWHAQDGGEDDGRVTEDHQDYETDKHNMQNCVISWTCNLRGKQAEDGKNEKREQKAVGYHVFILPQATFRKDEAQRA